jgi:hypothetical protein
VQDNVCERYSHIGTAQGSKHYVLLGDPLSVPVALFLPRSLFAASVCWAYAKLEATIRLHWVGMW